VESRSAILYRGFCFVNFLFVLPTPCFFSDADFGSETFLEAGFSGPFADAGAFADEGPLADAGLEAGALADSGFVGKLFFADGFVTGSGDFFDAVFAVPGALLADDFFAEAGFEVAGFEVAGFEVAGFEVAGFEVADFEVGVSASFGAGVFVEGGFTLDVPASLAGFATGGLPSPGFDFCAALSTLVSVFTAVFAGTVLAAAAVAAVDLDAASVSAAACSAAVFPVFAFDFAESADFTSAVDFLSPALEALVGGATAGGGTFALFEGSLGGASTGRSNNALASLFTDSKTSQTALSFGLC
jgi:hypothetical protein